MSILVPLPKGFRDDSRRGTEIDIPPRLRVEFGDPWHLPSAHRWCSPGIRRTEWRIWLGLPTDEPTTVAAIAEATGFHRHTVAAALNRMHTAREVFGSPSDGWVRSTSLSLYDEVPSSIQTFSLQRDQPYSTVVSTWRQASMTPDYMDALERVVAGLHAIVATGSVHPGYIKLTDSTLVAAADHISDYITSIRAMESDARLAHPRRVPVPPASPGLIAQMVCQARLEDTSRSDPPTTLLARSASAAAGDGASSLPAGCWPRHTRCANTRSVPARHATPTRGSLHRDSRHACPLGPEANQTTPQAHRQTGWTPRLIVGGLSDHDSGDGESLDQLALFGAESERSRPRPACAFCSVPPDHAASAPTADSSTPRI